MQKDVQNLASKQIFVRWQAILSIFYFEIEFIKRDINSILNFLTREFLQDRPMPRKKNTKAKLSSCTKPNLIKPAISSAKLIQTWADIAEVEEEEEDHTKYIES